MLTQYCLQTLAQETFSTFLTILIQQDIFRLNGFFISSHLFTLSLPRYSVILSIQEHFLETYDHKAQVSQKAASNVLTGHLLKLTSREQSKF